MWSSIIYLAIAIFGARTLSAYHPDFLFQSHIDLKRKIIALLLVDRSVSRHITGHRCEANEQKITIVGIIIYCALALNIMLSVILIFIIPLVEYDGFDTGKFALQGTTYNEQTVAFLIGALLSFEAGLYFCNIIKINKNSYPRFKIDKAINIIFAIVFFITGISFFTSAINSFSHLF